MIASEGSFRIEVLVVATLRLESHGRRVNGALSLMILVRDGLAKTVEIVLSFLEREHK